MGSCRANLADRDTVLTSTTSAKIGKTAISWYDVKINLCSRVHTGTPAAVTHRVPLRPHHPRVTRLATTRRAAGGPVCPQWLPASPRRRSLRRAPRAAPPASAGDCAAATRPDARRAIHAAPAWGVARAGALRAPRRSWPPAHAARGGACGAGWGRGAACLPLAAAARPLPPAGRPPPAPPRRWWPQRPRRCARVRARGGCCGVPRPPRPCRQRCHHRRGGSTVGCGGPPRGGRLSLPSAPPWLAAAARRRLPRGETGRLAASAARSVGSTPHHRLWAWAPATAGGEGGDAPRPSTAGGVLGGAGA